MARQFETLTRRVAHWHVYWHVYVVTIAGRYYVVITEGP